jgi:hypothetical protein
MSNIVLWEGKLPVARKVAQSLALQCSNMHLVAEVGKMAMDEVSDVHAFVEYKVRTTLDSVELLHRGTSSEEESTPLQEVGRVYRTRLYLDSMTRIAEATGAKIVALTDGFHG